ncbi:hypothetical protein C0J52_16921, partial [Blattella germanica]
LHFPFFAHFIVQLDSSRGKRKTCHIRICRSAGWHNHCHANLRSLGFFILGMAINLLHFWRNWDCMKLVAPFLEIFTSLPMWALIIAHSGQNWGFWTLLTEMPTYMNGNSLLSALPYLVMWILSFGFSWVSDFIMNKNYVTKCTSRKIFNSIGHWIPGIALIALAFPTGDGNTTLPVALLTLAVGVNSATYVGFQVNHIDLSPNYAGTMMGITNCASNIMSIIAPLLVGQIVTDEHDDSQWRIVFFIASGIYFAGNLFFVLFGKADIQVWNDPDYNSKKAVAGTDDIDMKEVDGKDKY